MMVQGDSEMESLSALGVCYGSPDSYSHADIGIKRRMRQPKTGLPS
jgi:hypothetical protein